MVLKPVLGCRPYIGDWAAVELCVWFIGQGPSFLVKKNFVPELCGKLANWDLMHYR